MKNAVLYIVILCLSFSCRKKELPKEEYTEPVFYISCDIDGAAKKLEAGNSDYYMNTSCGKDSSNVYFFRGDLGQTTFENGRDYKITVIVSDYKITLSNMPANTDSALRIGSHLYNDQIVPATQDVSFLPLRGFDSAHLYKWVITDGSSDTRTLNNYSLTETFQVGKKYSVLFDDDDQQGSCNPTLSNTFKIGNKLQTTVSADRDSSDLSELKYNFSYTLPFGYNKSEIECQWSFADGTTSSTPKSSKVFQFGRSLVKLVLKNKNTGDSCVSFYQVDATTGKACHANYLAIFHPIIDKSIYATVTILLTDKDGVVYSSRSLAQPSTSYFQLVSVDPYKVNLNGDPTNSLNIKFNCLVKNGTKTIALTNGQGVIAVAHK